MQLENTQYRFGLVAQTIHWLVFVAFVAMFIVAEIMMDMKDSPTKWQLYALHKSTGIVILFVVFFRIYWRMLNPTPVLPAHMRRVEKMLAHLSHFLLYMVMLLMPLSGYIMSMAGGHGITVYGMWEMPNFVGLDKDMSKIAHTTHHWTATIIYYLVGLHAFAALWHHFVKKDSILHRMLPVVKNPEETKK